MTYKVMFITTGLEIGGAELMLCNLLSKLNRQSFSPIVLSLIAEGKVGERIKALGVPVYSLNMEPGKFSLKNIQQLLKLTFQLKPDLIQGWMYHGNLAAQFAAFFHNKPVIWSIHSSLHNINSDKASTVKIIQFCKFSSYFIDRVLFVSQTSRIQHESFGFVKKSNQVIPNGFDLSVFLPNSQARQKLRLQLNLPPEALLIGLIARYHPCKDHQNFLEAAALLVNNHPQAYFILAGTRVEQDNSDLQEIIQRLNLEQKVYLLGEQHNIAQVTAGLDLSTSSSNTEAFPVVVGEAMACGVPCVVTDVGDSAFLVGDTGKVVPPRNATALAKAWEEMIELEREGREKLGKAARKRIENNFSLESVTQQYESVYQEILAQRV